MKRVGSISQRPIYSIGMIVALAILVPLIAVLQYRWIGQVSEAELTNQRNSLNIASGNSIREINDELEQITDEFVIRQPRVGSPGAGPPSAGIPFPDAVLEDFTRQISEDYDNWQATSLNAALLRNVYVHRVGTNSYRRFDPVAIALVEDAPPISQFARWFSNPNEVPGRMRNEEVFGDGQLWVISDVVGRGRGRGRGGPMSPDADYRLLFEVSPDVLWNEIVPESIETRFDQLDYRVAIEDTTNRTVLYRSDDSISYGTITEADTNLQITPGFARRFRVLGPEIHIVAQHELGSLTTAVEAARRRNLVVGLGIFVLLAATGAMIVVWSERVRSVGRLQMEFAAGISHELRTPLATIRTAAHNIASGIVKSPEQVREYAEIVLSEGRRLSAMVDQTIQFAHTESGRRHYDLHPVEVGSVIDRATETALPSATEGGNRIEVDRHPQLPPAMADETALTHCLVNLLTNAIKFGPADKPIQIEARHDPNTDRVAISVHNEGPGIDVDELPNLFEPFYRGHGTSQVPGSGLGLSLVRRMMSGQNGEVTVETAPGRGATFTLYVPAASKSEAEDGKG